MSEGVVRQITDVELPGMPSGVARPYDATVESIRTTLDTVREEIAQRVELRSTTNAEIKVLREEEERLTRMLRIAEA